MASIATVSAVDDFPSTPIKPSNNNDGNSSKATEYGLYDQDRARVEQIPQNQDAKVLADGMPNKTPDSEPNLVFGPTDSPWNAPKEISVREMDFEQFKNRYGMDDKYHIIEILIGTLQTADEIQNELNRRREGSGRRFYPLEEDKNTSSDSEWIQRVRIQSPMILGYLKHVAGGPGQYTGKPRIFLRPFEALELSFSDMKQHMEALEARWGDVVQLEDAGNFEGASAKQKQIEIEREIYRDVAKTRRSNVEIESEVNKRHVGRKKRDVEIKRANRDGGRRKEDISATSDNDDSKSTGSDASDDDYKIILRKVGGDDIDINDPKLDNSTALRHMRCYIHFVEQKLLPLQQKFRDPLNGRIRSYDLWHLFQVGDVIYSPRNSILQQQATFVVHGKWIQEAVNRNLDDLNNIGLTINCHYVDNFGDSYREVDHTFTIEGYEGESVITDLPVYPLFYTHDYEERKTELRKHGEHFMAMALEKHVYCQSWTLPDDPLGPKGKNGYNPSEYIDSDVIIDIAEALNQNSDGRLQGRMTWSSTPWHARDDLIEICHWSDERRTQLWLSTVEEVYQSGKNGSLMWTNLEGAGNEVGPFDIIDKSDYVLRSGSLILPRRFFVYVLRERKFVGVDVMTLEKIPPQETIFDDLQIDPDNKRMVKSLVAEHFQKRELQRIRPGIGFLNQDLIRGKGSGLFILLHGVPGVGKTATAEAVAQANDKPLFTITCGDLGFTPKEVEEELNRIFRLANKWDCVLLLDEADVFLARRDTWNLKRNALVSVFLRVLEYYSGILFLTTNRVGTMDEAFKSRIHITLYYEPLTRDQTVKIFWVNIEKLKKIEQNKEKRLKESGVDHPKLKIKAQDIARWALDYYDAAGVTNESMRWNGRQIRNAFQIASSLARYDTAKVSLGKDKVPCPVLDSSHFNLVAQTIEKFDTYMQHATGMADSDHARIEGTRADELRFSRDTQNRSSTVAANRKRGTQLGTPKQPRVPSREQDVKRPGTMPIRGNTAVPSSRQQTSRNAGPSSSRSQARAFEYPSQSVRLGPRGKQRVDEFDDEDEAMEASYMNNASLEEDDMDDEDYGDGNQDFYG